MTQVLFTTIIFVGLGFLIGKLFKNLNPFLMFIGFVILVAVSPAFIEANNTYYTICFVIGGILNFPRPVTAVKAYAREAMSTLSLRKQSDNINAQKKEIEEDLQRQKREAEEDIKKDREDLKREKEEYQRNKQEQDRKREQESSSSSSSSGDKKSNKNLDPQNFADACEILWMNQDRTLPEYKKAYKKLIIVYHTDKLKGLSPERLKEAEEETKQLNVAMETIEKKFE